MELPRFNPVSGATELINNSFRITEGYMNIFSRAQALKQSAEQFQMEKEQFVANAATTSLEQERLRGAIAEQNNRLIEQESALREKNNLRNVRSQRLRQAHETISAAMQNPRVWEDPMVAEFTQGEIMRKFADLEKDPEFAQLASQFVDRVTATKGGFLHLANSAAEGLAPSLIRISPTNLADRAEFEKLKASPFLQHAMRVPAFAQQFSALQKGFETASADEAKFNRDREIKQIEVNAKNRADQAERSVVGYRGAAPSLKEAQDFRAAEASLNAVNPGIDRLIQITNDSSSLEKLTDIQLRSEVDVLTSLITAENRTKIVGPGAVSESEWEMLRRVVANPTSLKNVAFRSGAVKALQTLKKTLNAKHDATAKILGLTRETTSVSAADVLSAAGVKPGP